jgi:mannose-6-phosphate isomerase
VQVVKLANDPRPYDWGIPGGIDQLRAASQPSSEPQAELWYGTHPHSPARIADPNDSASLPDVLQRAGVAEGTLPILLKILAVGRPLSIQVHPDAAQARAAYRAEAPLRAAGQPVDYADANPKPEMICAWSDEFEALAGVRPAAELEATLRQVVAASSDPLLVEAQQRLAQDGAGALVRWSLQHGVEASRALAAVLPALRPGAGIDAGRLASLRIAAAAFPEDRGLFVAALLNRVVLHRGEVLALPARQLHSYQRGIGVELMSCSDNVLRAGFTHKRVDVDELLRLVDPEPSAPLQVEPGDAAGWREFAPWDGLRLRRHEPVTVTGATTDRPANLPVSGPTLVLCLGGNAVLGDGVQLGPTEGALLLGEGAIDVSGEGVVFAADGSGVVRF